MSNADIAQHAQAYLRRIADNVAKYEFGEIAAQRLFATPRGRVAARIDALIAQIQEESASPGIVDELVEMLALFSVLSTRPETLVPPASEATSTPGVSAQTFLENAAELDKAATVLEAVKAQGETTAAIRSRLDNLQEGMAHSVASALNQLPKAPQKGE